MKICDTKDYGEIVFEGRDCKVCERINDLKEHRRELADGLVAANRRIAQLEEDLGAEKGAA